jgi:hypothetical protein
MSEQKLSLFWLILVPLAVTAMALPVIIVLTAILLLWFVHLWNTPFWLVCTLGVIFITCATFVVWWSMRRMARRRFQFSLRSLLIATAVFAVIVSLLWNGLNKIGHQQQSLMYIAADGGYVYPWGGSENWLQKEYNFDPFRKVVGLDIRTDRAIPAILDHPNDFGDLLGILIYSGVSDAGLERMEEFNQFPKFYYVACNYINITDNGLEHIAKCTKMKELFINGASRITNEGFKHLLILPNLEGLYLYNYSAPMPITDAGLEHIGKMVKLKHLRIINLPITDAGLKYLQNLQNLEYLFVQSKIVTEKGLLELGKFLPDCWISLNGKTIPQQIKQLEIYETYPHEKQINRITDQERIAKIISSFEFDQGWSERYEEAEFPTRIRLDFLGRNRCLYQMRLGKEGVITQFNIFHPMSDQEEKDLFRLIGLETNK